MNQEPGWAVRGAGPPRERKCGCTGEDAWRGLPRKAGGRAQEPGVPPAREEEKGFGEGRLRTGAGAGARMGRGEGARAPPGPANEGERPAL